MISSPYSLFNPQILYYSVGLSRLAISTDACSQYLSKSSSLTNSPFLHLPLSSTAFHNITFSTFQNFSQHLATIKSIVTMCRGLIVGFKNRNCERDCVWAPCAKLLPDKKGIGFEEMCALGPVKMISDTNLYLNVSCPDHRLSPQAKTAYHNFSKATRAQHLRIWRP